MQTSKSGEAPLVLRESILEVEYLNGCIRILYKICISSHFCQIFEIRAQQKIKMEPRAVGRVCISCRMKKFAKTNIIMMIMVMVVAEGSVLFCDRNSSNPFFPCLKSSDPLWSVTRLLLWLPSLQRRTRQHSYSLGHMESGSSGETGPQRWPEALSFLTPVRRLPTGEMLGWIQAPSFHLF